MTKRNFQSVIHNILHQTRVADHILCKIAQESCKHAIVSSQLRALVLQLEQETEIDNDWVDEDETVMSDAAARALLKEFRKDSNGRD